MARIRKEYKMTEKNVEYIEEVKEKNNLIILILLENIILYYKLSKLLLNI